MNDLEKALFDCKGKSKIHHQDLRLFNNAGMKFPTCKANADMLNLEYCWLPISANIEDVTCKHCLKTYMKGRSF